MSQERIWDFGVPFSAARARKITLALHNPGCYSGYDISVVGPDTIELSSGGFLMTPDGVVITETSPIRLRQFPLPVAPTDFTITCRHTDNGEIGGTLAIYRIELGLFASGSLSDGVVLGWINYPGAGVPFNESHITKAPCGTISGADIGPASGDLDGVWPDIDVVGISGIPIDLTGLSDQYILSYDLASNTWVVAAAPAPVLPPATGDIVGTYPNLIVAGIRSTPISPALVPAFGDVLTWDGTQWIAQASAPSAGSDALVSSAGAWTVPSGSNVGDMIYASGSMTGQVADRSSASTANVIGVILNKPSATTATLVYSGRIGGYVGLTSGANYYLGVSGAITSTPLDPTNPVNFGFAHVNVGTAMSPTTLLFRPGPLTVL